MRFEKFCIIDWRVRMYYGISLNEYALLDTVKCLAEKKGYCYASRKYLSQLIGVTERGLSKMIDRLIDRALLAKTTGGKLLVTKEWKRAYEFDIDECMSKEDELISEKDELSSKESHLVQEKHEQSSGNNNNIQTTDNDKDKEGFRVITDFYKAKLEKRMNGTKPHINWALFTKKIHPLYQEYGTRKLISALTQFFNDSWAEKTGFKPQVFESDVNRYLGMEATSNIVDGEFYDPEMDELIALQEKRYGH